MAMRRSTQMLILGLAISAIGAGVVLVSFMGSDKGGDKAATATTSTCSRSPAASRTPAG